MILGLEGALATQNAHGDLLQDVVDVGTLQSTRTQYCRNPGLRDRPGLAERGAGQPAGCALGICPVLRCQWELPKFSAIVPSRQ